MAAKQEPMIRLEPGGVAPILSYNVPEPTSYSGRNYIDLQIDSSLWKEDPGLEPDGTLPGGSAEARSEARSAGGRAMAALETARAALQGRSAAEGEPLVEAASLRLAGAEPGAATVRDEPTFASPAPSASMMMRMPDDEWDPEPEPEIIVASISSHATGATIRGPHTGAQVTFSGTASADLDVRKVEFKVGSAAYQPASLSGDRWSYSTVFAAPGTAITLRLLVTSVSGKTAARSITVNVALDPAPDTVDPTLAIQSPADGTTIVQGESGTSVLVQGTAGDVGSGVRSVEIAVNGGGWSPATAVSPGYAVWSHPLSFTRVGQYRIDARCTDGAGRSTTRSVHVEILGRDTAPPTFSILSPQPNARLTGPFEGVTVSLEGVSQDDNAVASVELFVNGNPAPIPAQPLAGATLDRWAAPVTFNTRGPNLVRVVCRDVHGNEREQTVHYQVELIPQVTTRLTRLILVESYRLSSYLGNYGAGRTIKTFSLLPGEKTRISVKTFTRSEEDRKASSSILDSYSTHTQEAFEKSMENEQTNRKAYEETEAYTVAAEAKASWGWGSAGISASASVGTNAAREEFAKSISAATQKHVSEASAKRDVQINTSYEVKTSSGEETAVEREIQNVNMSRTLNFVFRQMNQEYISLLHLVDVRIGYFKVIEVEGQATDQYIYREVTLPQLYPLLQTVLETYEGTDASGQPDPDRNVREVYNQIVFQLMNLYDYQDVHHGFAEWRELQGADGKPQDRYLRAKKDYVSLYHDAASETTLRVPGIIMAANRYVLRTEGIMVEALLGQGDALDEYSHGLQDEAVRERRIANDRELAEIQRLRLANRILEEKDVAAAQIYSMMTYPAGPVPVGELTVVKTEG